MWPSEPRCSGTASAFAALGVGPRRVDSAAVASPSESHCIVEALLPIALLEKANQFLVGFGAFTLLANGVFPCDELLCLVRGNGQLEPLQVVMSQCDRSVAATQSCPAVAAPCLDRLPHIRVRAGVSNVPQGREIIPNLMERENLSLGLEALHAGMARNRYIYHCGV